MNFAERFDNPFAYSEYEYKLARDFIIPELDCIGMNLKGKKLADVGCGFGGCSVAFAESKVKCTSFDLSKHQIEIANKFAKLKKVKIRFFIDNICNLKTKGNFDVIIFRDVVEYVDNPIKALKSLKKMLNRRGLIYITFPPWYGPYGGHQHHPDSITRFMPFVHLLPKCIYFNMLKNKRGLMIKETNYLEEVKKISTNKISIIKFEKLIKRMGLRIFKKNLYILRPAFKIRYGTPIIRSGFFGKMPILNELITTGAEYILTK